MLAKHTVYHQLSCFMLACKGYLGSGRVLHGYCFGNEVCGLYLLSGYKFCSEYFSLLVCLCIGVCACVRVCVCICARVCGSESELRVRGTAWFEKMCQVLATLNSFAIPKSLKIVFSLIVVLVC